MNYSPFGDYLRMNISGGLNHFQLNGNSYSHTYTDPFYVISLNSDVKNFNFNLLIYKRRYSFSGETSREVVCFFFLFFCFGLFFLIYKRSYSFSGETSREADRFNRLGIGYRIGKVQLSASFSTQFTSSARYRSKNHSAIAPYVTDQRFGDIYPGFVIGFSYHLDFGRKYKSVDRKVYNSDNESGILNSRK